MRCPWSWLCLLPLWRAVWALLRSCDRRCKGRGGKLGMILEMRSALAPDNPAERRMALQTLLFFVYFGSLAGAWIDYTAMLGI